MRHSEAQWGTAERQALDVLVELFPVHQQTDVNNSALITHLPKILPGKNVNNKVYLSRPELSCYYEPGETSQSYAYLAKFTEQDYII